MTQGWASESQNFSKLGLVFPDYKKLYAKEIHNFIKALDNDFDDRLKKLDV